MQTAHLLLSLGGDHGNTVMKFGCTAAEIAVLREIHGAESVKEIEPQADIKRSHREERQRLIAIYGAARSPEQKPIVEGLYPGAAARVFESLHELDLDESFFKATGRMAADGGPTAAWPTIDPNSGPTVGEWIGAGYAAKSYPPSGYNSKSTQEEIDAAIAAQEAKIAGDSGEANTDGSESDEDGVGDDINDEHAEKDILG